MKIAAAFSLSLLCASTLALDPYQFVTVRNFVIDGPRLAAKHAKIKLIGSYVRQGNASMLYADTQAVIMARYHSDAGTQPSVVLLTDDASHKLREALVSCDSNPGASQVGCQIEILGEATICTLNNVFGATHNAPCVDVTDGGRW